MDVILGAFGLLLGIELLLWIIDVLDRVTSRPVPRRHHQTTAQSRPPE